MKLSKRQTSILKDLALATNPVSVATFTEKYHMSERSIRYDLTSIRDYLAENNVQLRIINGQGYYIPFNWKSDCLQLLGNNDLNENEEYKKNLIDDCYKVLFLQAKPLSAESLGNMVGGSINTIRNIIKEQNTLDEEVHFKCSKNGVTLSGKEYLIRKQAYPLLKELTSNDSNDMLETIANYVREANRYYDVWETKESFENTVHYCRLAKLRQRKLLGSYNEELLKSENSKYAEYLLKMISVIPSEIEIASMIDMMIENGVFVSDTSKDKLELVKRIKVLVSKMVDICKLRGWDVNESGLTKDLINHLYQFQKSVDYGIPLSSNLLLSDIKQRYKNYYEVARQASEGFEVVKGTSLPEDEIGYLAIYLYKNLSWNSLTKKRALIVCATGKGISTLLVTSVKNGFPELKIVGIESAYGASQSQTNADFIISTVEVKNANIPVIIVQPAFTDVDRHKVSEFLHMASSDIKKYQQKTSLAEGYSETISQFNLTGTQAKKSAELVASIELTLLDSLSRISVEIPISSNIMCGLIIHTLLAIPRWLSEDSDKRNEEFYRDELRKIKNEHATVYKEMLQCFAKMENQLAVTLKDKERYAYFLYILGKEGQL